MVSREFPIIFPIFRYNFVDQQLRSLTRELQNINTRLSVLILLLSYNIYYVIFPHIVLRKNKIKVRKTQLVIVIM